MTLHHDGDVRGGTVVFTGARSRQGYRLNKLASSLRDPVNRKAFLGDEAAYMDRFGLDNDEKALVAARDWQRRRGQLEPFFFYRRVRSV